MATYIEIYNLFDNANLQNRTAVAILKTANYIITTEAPETANHANRVTWANQALVDPRAMAKKMIWSVLGNASIQASGEAATDNDIQWVVDTDLNLYATGS